MTRYPVEHLGQNVLDDNGDVKPWSDFVNGEAPDERLVDVKVKVPDTHTVQAAAAAAVRSMDNEAQMKRYPREIGAIIAARKARQVVGVEHDDAYASLGGGVKGREQAGLPLENVLDDDYEPWQVDITRAVEQFGIAEFSLTDFKRLDQADYRRFSLHFYAYLQGIEKAKWLIDHSEGRPQDDPDLHRIYGDRSLEELQKYRRSLDWLTADLEATGIPRSVRVTLGAPERVTTETRPIRNSLLKEAHDDNERRHRHAHGIQVVSARGNVSLETIYNK